MKKLLAITGLGSVFSLACTGLMGSTVTVNLPGADGLVAGQPVHLNGIQIGEVQSVDFREGTDGVVAVLSISDDNLSRLDPETLFVVLRNKEAGPPRIMSASNICVETPRGLTDGAILDGYSGPMAKVVLQAGVDRPECAAAVVEQLILDLQSTTIQLEGEVNSPQ